MRRGQLLRCVFSSSHNSHPERRVFGIRGNLLLPLLIWVALLALRAAPWIPDRTRMSGAAWDPNARKSLRSPSGSISTAAGVSPRSELSANGDRRRC